ncbi:hypothetical protein [Winogradskyella aurantiaca]|uniref:hypothetical protein n=1 Tax=Winogradskyella aurantiaca TaxID=2219558 RepID=UPI000E1CB5A5|nr:hypothetical protein [Winogradskyella aurantiaca]
MKNFLIILTLLTLFNCSDNDDIDLTLYNEKLTVLENLNNGVPVSDVVASVNEEDLIGLEFGGGHIYYVNQMRGTVMIAANYSDLGPISWGDHFDFTNSQLIGDGKQNTLDIVLGNANDNSNVPNGLEFGSDNYVFKIVTDLDYRNFNDWFVPSKNSAEAIFNNLHAHSLGDFDTSIFYWTSSKVEYQPFVISFNEVFDGEAFLGSCFDTNSVIIVREM